MGKLASEIIANKQRSFDDLATKRALWDRVEELFHGQLNDLNSQQSASKVFDPKLSTLTIERGYRVMAQLGVGKVRGISTNDIGDAKLKNLLLEKYVIPNANAQFDVLTKFRMIDIYSNLYGNMFALIDQDVKRNGYVGPDFWILNIRDVFPQMGAVSLEDSDEITIRTWKPLSYFENLKKSDGFINIPKILEKLEKQAGSKQNRDADNNSKRNQDQYPGENPGVGKGFYEVLTRFERDRWVDVVVDADMEFRDQKNPHDDEDLPVACKYSIPLLDDIMGMGDFERGGSMQQVVNSTWNLYLDAVKMSIFPPVIINKDNVASPSSFKPLPGAQWLARGNVNNVAQPIQLTPAGINTFNNTYQVANAAILNLFGTTDTAVTAQTDAGFGKTPQAIQAQVARENTRDNADRFYMEQFVTKVMKKMVNLMCKNQTGSVAFRMFPEEIEQLARDYPEIKDLYNEKTGKLTVKKGRKNVMYDYEIVSGSTFAVDQKAQQDNLQMFMQMYLQSQTPNGNMFVETLKQEGYNFKFGELFKKIFSNSGIQDWDKILQEMNTEEMGEGVLNQHAQEFMQVLQGLTQQNIGAVPPQPGQIDPMGGQIPMDQGVAAMQAQGQEQMPVI